MNEQNAIKKFDLETYETLVAYNGDILFEWDLVTDRFYTTGNLFDIFGYMPADKHFSQALVASHNIHPDDKHIIQEFFETIQYNFHDLKNRKYYACLEIRIRNAFDKFIWCKIRLAAHYSAQNLPFKISGMITDVDFDKKYQEHLIRESQSDSLTGLYHQDAAASFIEENLKKTAPGHTHALILVNLDGLDALNVQFGQLFTDIVISGLAADINHQFLKSDIIGRFGIGQFSIFTTNIASVFTLREKLDGLMSVLRRTYRSESNSTFKIAADIGVALYPAHGESYAALFSNAAQALDYVMKNGKNEYAVYQERMPKAIFNKDAAPPQRKSFDANFPEYLARLLHSTADSSAAITLLLEITGKKLDVSRAYIYERSADDAAYTQCFAWCAKGVAALDQSSKEVSADLIDSLYQHLDREKFLNCTNPDTLSPNHSMLFQKNGTLSFLHSRAITEDKPLGYIGFDECRKERLWTPEEIEVATFLADILTTFLLSRRAEKNAVQVNSTNANLLDAIDSYLYVVNPSSYHLLFINKKLRDKLTVKTEDKTEELKCYQIIYQNDEPCANCPIKKPAAPCGEASEEISENEQNHHAKRTAATIAWNDHPSCRLIQTSDITPETKPTIPAQRE